MKLSNDFSYEDALSFIHGSLKLGSKLGLTNIRELCERIGRPQDSLQFVHIAGTNGKGTVTSSLAAVLTAAGYRTGAYTSPFVYRFNERIQIDGEEVADAQIAKNTYIVKCACEEMVRDGFNHPTEFEIVTALGLLCFKDAACRFVTLEVGLGGRLDATNVIENPLCTVITSIGYDHMQYLGETLSEIAAEKCGILKEGAPIVIYGEQPNEALSVIRAKCSEMHATMKTAPLPKVKEASHRGTAFSAGNYENLFLPLAGEHMAKNVCITLSVIDVLREKGIQISDAAVYEGIKNVRHRGRLETIGENPLFILDGAHNDDGITALKKAAGDMFGGKKLIGITGMLADKEYEKAMEKIGGIFASLYTVTVPSPRALSADDLKSTAEKYNQNVCAASSVEEAVRLALSEKPDVILAFGSLYMLSDMKAAYDKVKGETA